MITERSEDPAFGAYLDARHAVQLIKQACASSDVTEPSDYWAEELDQIDYLADASPLIIRKLRHHAFHITGIRPYDYREKGHGRRQNFEARLQALRSLDDAGLLVPESPALGGFGYEIDGRLFNVDTLKFYEVLIGMHCGGVLAALREIDRPLVCEIGAGWGGFAYQFKTLFPRATYVIVDFPELFLFSATYLKSVFPDATLRFVGAEADPMLDGRPDADFVFVPNTLAHLVSSLPLDLTVNMVSFQEMTEAQVRAYVRIAADAQSPLLYSLNRERSPYNTELASVSRVLSEHYGLTEVSVLDSDYTTMMKGRPKPGKAAERSELGYRHLVGRLSTTRPRVRETAETVATTPREPRVVLGMTLYNNARHLRDALESLLAQTYSDFMLVLLDDASSDHTETIAQEYAARDARIRYFRHADRKAMIATWREVAVLAARECPSAVYFAWVSDHDRWHSRWLAAMVAELDRDPGLVLTYPITRRITVDTGDELDKGPRLFETTAFADVRSRWRYFCRHGVGAGDMVYGLMRLDALQRAGIFRTVLRPDRLLIAELTLIGRIRQVSEVLWFRRQSAATSVSRQRHTLVLPGEAPRGFGAPPWLQHARVLWREYVQRAPRPIPLSTAQWAGMLVQYQVFYGWRHLRKSETSHAVGRSIDNAIWVKKITRHYYHQAVYHTLVGGRGVSGKLRRLARRGLYHVLVLMHRVGLRRGSEETPVQ
jgi:hypothetical protein